MGADDGTELKKFGPPHFTYTSGPPADAICGLFGITGRVLLVQPGDNVHYTRDIVNLLA